MRIEKIIIKGLFGMFDHVIPLNLKERITIIYGINGIGKTTIFKILDAFFNSKLNQLINLPFKELNIVFEKNYFINLKINNENLEIEHNTENNNEQIIISRDIIDKSFYTNKNIEKEGNLEIINNIINPTNLFYEETIDKSSTLTKFIRAYNELRKLSKIYFIQTQRLLILTSFSQKNKIYSEKSKKFMRIETVNKYSDELAGLILQKHYEYAKLSEEFELSMSKRLMNKEITAFSNDEELRKENELLEHKRLELNSVGLFEEMKEEHSKIPDKIDDISRAVLSVNIQDMKKKLEIFDELYTKLKLFLDILNNRRFSFKSISIHPKEGFVFKNDNDKLLNAADLSSGEQHELVLLYELLFKVSENSIILIDEPEISFHVVWQKDFLTDMAEIVKIRNIDILLATHSPSIINGNWDLTVELSKEVPDEK